MKVNETIAFIGEANQETQDLIRKLAMKNYPLVLVAKEGHPFFAFSRQVLDDFPQADIEIIDCAKEGCWEADVIVLTGNGNPETELIEKIKEVAAQKILVYFTGTKNNFLFPGEEIKILQQSLPYSQVIQVTGDSVSQELTIFGAEAPATLISYILSQAGYNPKLLQIAC